MRRIISFLVIARLIQRLMNGSRRSGPRRHVQQPGEPPQGNAPARPEPDPTPTRPEAKLPKED